MYFSYKGLWKKLIDAGMQKQELKKQASISAASMYKLNNGLNVNTDTLLRICRTLNCDAKDIMEIVWEDREEDTVSIDPAKDAVMRASRTRKE